MKVEAGAEAGEAAAVGIGTRGRPSFADDGDSDSGNKGEGAVEQNAEGEDGEDGKQ